MTSFTSNAGAPSPSGTPINRPTYQDYLLLV
jgi:hypothetical protein